MAVKRTSYFNSQRSPQGFMDLLSSAACEWFLIFLLFVDASFSYWLTRFANYCNLQTHCLLCSRLDHVFGNEKPDFYRRQLCSNHRKEISSLVYCHVHGKLADVRDMCEECVMSFIIQNKSSSDSYRLFVGKLGLDFERYGFQSSSNFMRSCSCCNMSWKSKSNAQRLLHITPIGIGARANVKPPLPRTPGRSRFSRRDCIKKARNLGIAGTDPMSHVGYSELKFTSDSDSEVPFSSDDDVKSLFHKKFESNEDVVVPKTQAKNLPNHGPSLLDQIMQVEGSESHVAKCLASDFIGHGLGELVWGQINQNPKIPSSLPELISLDNVPPSSNIPSSQRSSLFSLSELVSLDVMPPPNAVTIPSPEKLVVDGTKTSDIGHTFVSKHTESPKMKSTMSEQGFRIDQVLHNNTPPHIANGMDPSNVSELVVGNKGLALEVSSVHLKQPPLDSSNKELAFEVSSVDLKQPPLDSRNKELAFEVSSVDLKQPPLDSNTKELAPEVSSVDLKQPQPLLDSNTKELALEVSSVDLKQPQPPLDSSTKELALEVSSVDLKQPQPPLDSSKKELALEVSSVDLKQPQPPLDSSKKELALEVSSVDLKQPQPPLDSKGVHEDAKLSPHISSRIDGMHNVDHEELGRSDASSSNGIPIPSVEKSASLERKETGCESVDGISAISEIEGESMVDRLKRQIEHDRQCMSALYKELEEERSASTIAANEAMAMITRLQQEKAALHMEALQYLRMMEEQAEYDMDALEKANDLIAEKEKEIQDLEAELEFYKNIIDDTLALYDDDDHDETNHLNNGDQSMMMVDDMNDLHSIENNPYVPDSNSMLVDDHKNDLHSIENNACVPDSNSMLVDDHKNELHSTENNAHVPSNSMSNMVSEGSDKTINVETSCNSDASGPPA